MGKSYIRMRLPRRTMTELRDAAFDAISRGDIPALQAVIDNGLDVNAQYHNMGRKDLRIHNTSVLLYAVFTGNIPVVVFLIRQGANVHGHEHSMPPLCLACEEGYLQMAVTLLEYGADARAGYDSWYGMPIHRAASKGHVHVVTMLLTQAGVHIDILNKESALFLAIKDNHTEMINYLLDRGADVNAFTSMEKAPMCEAVKKESSELARRLLEKGARVISNPGEVGVLLHEAVKVSSFQNICLLLDEDVDVNQADRHGNTVLHICCREYYNINDEITSFLIGKGADVHAIDTGDYTPIMNAVQCADKISTVEILIKHGAYLNQINIYGENALHISVQKCKDDGSMVRLIIKHVHDIDIDAVDRQGKTALRYALEMKNLGAIKALVTGGAFIGSDYVKAVCVLRYKDVLCMMLERHPHLRWVENILEFAVKHGRNNIIGVLVHIPPFKDNMPNVNEDVKIVRSLHDYASFVDELKSMQRELDEAHSTRRTPLHLALFLPDPGVALDLLHGCMRLDARDADGRTLVHYAVFCRKPGIVRELVARGAPCDLPDAFGETPTAMAMRVGSVDALQELLPYGVVLPLNNDDPLQTHPETRDFLLGIVHMVRVFHPPHGMPLNTVLQNDNWCDILAEATGMPRVNIMQLCRYVQDRHARLPPRAIPVSLVHNAQNRIGEMWRIFGWAVRNL